MQPSVQGWKDHFWQHCCRSIILSLLCQRAIPFHSGGDGGIWGEPERAPHSRALQDVRPSSWCLSDLAYDRISKCNVAPPARVLDQTRVQVARTTVPSQACYALRRCYKLHTTDLQRSAGGRDSLGNLEYSSQVQCSLVPSPTPSFSLLAVRTSLAVGQATKSWAWDWERRLPSLVNWFMGVVRTLGYVLGGCAFVSGNVSTFPCSFDAHFIELLERGYHELETADHQ